MLHQVDLVQRDRQQFAHIDDEELAQRTSYIATTKQALTAISADYKVPCMRWSVGKTWGKENTRLECLGRMTFS
jgi:hypothetical protein